MQILPVVLLSIRAAFSPTLPATSSAIDRSDPVLVRTVIDGDTIDVTTFGRVRLLGIDAPEIGRGFDTAAPFGREARDRLTALVLHRWVRLEREAPFLDVYNRHLAYVMREDGVFVNAVLVREGMARVSARMPLTRLDELQRAQAEAQTFRRGMWSTTPGTLSASYTSSSRKVKTVKTPPTSTASASHPRKIRAASKKRRKS